MIGLDTWTFLIARLIFLGDSGAVCSSQISLLSRRSAMRTKGHRISGYSFTVDSIEFALLSWKQLMELGVHVALV
jgi:hypothetical protein